MAVCFSMRLSVRETALAVQDYMLYYMGKCRWNERSGAQHCNGLGRKRFSCATSYLNGELEFQRDCRWLCNDTGNNEKENTHKTDKMQEKM